MTKDHKARARKLARLCREQRKALAAWQHAPSGDSFALHQYIRATNKVQAFKAIR